MLEFELDRDEKCEDSEIINTNKKVYFDGWTDEYDSILVRVYAI